MNNIFNKPNIIISKCLNFDNCRFNGDKVNDQYIEKLSNFINFIPVCPEVAIGLSTPRLPLRIFKEENSLRLYQPGTKTDLTEKMDNFSLSFLNSQKDIDGFILKNRSPSCGIGDVKIYHKKDSITPNNKNGIGSFTKNINLVFPQLPKEDEGRLKNYILREEFLTKIFCISEFRSIRIKKDIGELNNFQAKNKYLFMFFSPEKQVELGRIIASYDKTNLEDIFDTYYYKLLELFYTQTNIGKMINTLTHIFGYFKKTCSKEEKEFFLETIEVYREGRIPTSSVINIIKTWALRDKQEYILKQTILNPYPKELIELSDSGKILKL